MSCEYMTGLYSTEPYTTHKKKKGKRTAVGVIQWRSSTYHANALGLIPALGGRARQIVCITFDTGTSIHMNLKAAVPLLFPFAQIFQ